MSKSITLAVSLDNFRPKVDKSYTLTFGTSELSEDQVIQLVRLHGRIGVLHFAEKDQLNADDLVKLDEIDMEFEKKTPSQRLRSVIWILHIQQGGTPENFKTFYEQYVERIITSIKTKLDQGY